MNLRLLQLGDSALPIGGYSHSWGLEAAIDQDLVRDPVSLERWVRRWLRYALGPFEGTIVGSVCRGGAATALEANELLWTGLTPPTLRLASRDMGEQLLALAECWPWAIEAVDNLGSVTRARNASGGLGQWHHTPVFATLAAAAGSEAHEAVAVFLHQAAIGMITAGVRAVPIGHTHGQQILARLQDDIDGLSHELADRPLDSAGSSCPAYEVLCDAQSKLYTRLFRS